MKLSFIIILYTYTHIYILRGIAIIADGMAVLDTVMSFLIHVRAPLVTGTEQDYLLLYFFIDVVLQKKKNISIL